MKAFSKLLLGCAVAAAIVLPASAQIALSLSPTSYTVGVGGTETFNLNISGLNGSADIPSGPALGGFAVTLDYNSAIVSVQSIAYGTNLNLLGSGDDQYTDLSVPNQIYVSDTSYASAATLENLQPSSFTLATITLQGVAPGASPLTIDANLTNPSLSNTSLTDENANTLDLVNVTNASLTVIPEPSVTASVFGAVALGFCMLRRRFARNANCLA